MRRHFFTVALALSLFPAEKMHAAVLYRVSGISDFTLPAWNITDPAISSYINLCAYTSLGGTYSVTVTSVGGYVLSSGLHTIAYTLKWEDSGAGNLGSNGGTALTNAVPLTGRQHANTSLASTDCSTGSPAGATARLTLNITQAAMTAALAGTYGGTLLILIGP